MYFASELRSYLNKLAPKIRRDNKLSEDLRQVSRVQGMAKEMIQEIIENHTDACVLVIGPKSVLKATVMEQFVNEHHCYVGGNPKWLLNASIDTIHDTLVKTRPCTTLLDVDEEDVMSPTLRATIVDKLTQAGFDEIIGVYIDNSFYLAIEAHFINKFVNNQPIVEGQSDDMPPMSTELVRRIMATMSGMNDESKKVCEWLVDHPPVCSEFSGGLLRLQPTLAVALT